jgi:hypothetical protein
MRTSGWRMLNCVKELFSGIENVNVDSIKLTTEAFVKDQNAQKVYFNTYGENCGTFDDAIEQQKTLVVMVEDHMQGLSHAVTMYNKNQDGKYECQNSYGKQDPNLTLTKNKFYEIGYALNFKQ